MRLRGTREARDLGQGRGLPGGSQKGKLSRKKSTLQEGLERERIRRVRERGLIPKKRRGGQGKSGWTQKRLGEGTIRKVTTEKQKTGGDPEERGERLAGWPRLKNTSVWRGRPSRGKVNRKTDAKVRNGLGP